MDNAHARPIDRWFASHCVDHRDTTNRRIHVVCVAAILWSVIALLWCIPAPGTWFREGFWAGVAMLGATLFHYRASRPLGLGMAVAFIVLGTITRVLFDTWGREPLAWLATAVLVVAWIGQWIGHRLEGRKPNLFTDLTCLLIGPGRVLAKLYRRLGRSW